MILMILPVLVIAGLAIWGIQVAGAGPRWPFIAALSVSGGVALAGADALVVSAVLGRDSWNHLVSGSAFSEGATLIVLLVLGPFLLLASIALLVVGLVLHARQVRLEQHPPL